MKTLVLCCTFSMAICFGMAQPRQVVLRNGHAAIKYIPGKNESSYQAFKKFGMDEAGFLQLNMEEATDSTADENAIWLSVTTVLLAVCPGACVPLYYVAGDGDTFKSIGSYLGNLSPYVIKQLNPKLEAVSAGKWVNVGFVPAALFDSSGYDLTPAIKPVLPVPAVVPIPASDSALSKPSSDLPYNGAGFYANEFSEPATEKKVGKVTNFKSFGGWYDGKFYALMNGVPIGKVVKITNPQNGLFIFAKVVSGLPSLKTEKLLIGRINNAGCAALDIWNDAEFEVEISY
jgi:hypothetical protein